MAAEEIIEMVNSKRIAMEEFTSSSKKRKLICDQLSSFTGSVESVTISATPTHNPKEAIDLKHINSETEVCMISNGKFSEETSKSKELCGCGGNSGETMDSSSSSTMRKICASQTPAAAEIEEFFTTAEKYEQKRFSEKYNYDVMKDVPMEGRYKWIPLKL